MTLVRDEIILMAHQRVRVAVDGEPLSAEAAQTATRWLNIMVKAWQAEGLQMWRKTQATLFLASGQRSYLLGPGSTDHATAIFVETTLDTAALAAATEIELADAAGIADGDNIGVLIGTDLFWTTVDGAPVGGTVTLDDALTAAADAGTVVVAYTTKIDRPLHVLEARRRSPEGQEIPATVYARTDYLELPDKGATGFVTQVYYDKQLGDGVFHVWPVSDGRDRVLFTYARPLASLDTIEASPDFPEEWQLALVLNLADLLAPLYAYPRADRTDLKKDAAIAKAQVAAFDREDGSVFFQPDRRTHG